MRKILVIDYCLMCPYISGRACGHSGGGEIRIDDPHKIPSECPLTNGHDIDEALNAADDVLDNAIGVEECLNPSEFYVDADVLAQLRVSLKKVEGF